MIADFLFKKAEIFENQCQEALMKISFVRKLPNGKWRVVSRKGKNLGTFDSKEKAFTHLRQIEFFKHQGSADDQNSAQEKKNLVDLTDVDDLAYSAVVRKLREKASKEEVKQFLIIFKKEFDKAYKKKLNKPEKIALQNSLVKFNKIVPLKLPKKLVKKAAISELGEAELVGKFLADIIRFTMRKISLEKRPHSIQNLKQKLHNLDEKEIAGKKMPSSAAIGSAITFVKHVLFNQNPSYVREALNSVVRHL